MSIYSMSSPTYTGMSRQALFDSAMSQPLSLTSTLVDQGKGGALESFGLGTVLRENQLPVPAPSDEAPYGFDPSGLDAPAGISPQDYLQGNWVTPDMIAKKRAEMGALSEDQYKASPFYRKDIPYDPGMTSARAEALASMNDAQKVREFYAQKRPFAAFLGSMAGQALDPINYVPVAGEAVKAAAIARAGNIAGHMMVGALDAAANTAVFGLGTAGARAQFGDDVSWQALVSQVATAGLIGSAFGGIAGALGRRVDAQALSDAEQRLSTLKTTQEARIALNEGIDALARGEDIKLSPNATDPMARVAGDIAASRPERNFTTEVRGSGHGQMDLTLSMKDGGKDAGRIDYAEFDGRPSIQMIDVPEVARRNGNATALLQELQAKYPDQEIDWGSLTADGAKLREATSFKEVPSESAPLFAKLDEARNAEKALDAERTAKWEQGKSLDQQSPEVQDITAHQTDAMNAVSDLERELQGKTPTKQIIDVPPKVTAPRAIDASTARPEPRAEGVKEAEASVAKPENTKALAAQYSVDSQTGAFPEEADVSQLAAEGRLTADDAVTLAQAEADYHTGSAFAEALKSVAGCLL